jgi:hypothetical protein
VIGALGAVIAAVVTAGATLLIASRTGHLTTPGETREFQKDKQENVQLQQQIVGLQQQNTALRKELAAKLPLPTSVPEASGSSDDLVMNGGTFVAHLVGCSKQQDTATCAVKITNKKQERSIRFYVSKSSVIDSDGNEIKPDVVIAGGE